MDLCTAPEREITASWAGDSRCHVLRDDAKGDFDAFEAIREDPPLTNYISERIPNSIKQRHLLWNDWVLLICASDGVFNYLPTPMEFKFFILNSLMSSERLKILADEPEERLKATADDDISMVLQSLDLNSFDDIKYFYKKHLCELNEQFVAP